MAKTDFKSIDEYHKTFPKEIQERMQTIREIVKKVAPDAEEVISYGIPAFRIGKYHLIYYSSYAKHISLASPWSAAMLKELETELKGMKVTKSGIILPHDKPLPTALIKRIITIRKKDSKQVRE